MWGIILFILSLLPVTSFIFAQNRHCSFTWLFLDFYKEIRIHTHFYKCFCRGCFACSYLKCSSNPGNQIYNIFSTTLGIPIRTKELLNRPKDKSWRRFGIWFEVTKHEKEECQQICPLYLREKNYFLNVKANKNFDKKRRIKQDIDWQHKRRKLN